MKIRLTELFPPKGTYSLETVEVPDEHVESLLSVLIPFARLFANGPSDSPTKRVRERVAAAIAAAEIKRCQGL